MNNVSERTEMLLPEPGQALGALLGTPVPDLTRGAGLPLLLHWVYLLDRPAQADLGPDGHPLRGTVAAFPGRVLSVRDKQGRSGPLTFVTLEHQVRQRDRVVIDDQQDIVYRDAAAPTAQAAPSAGESLAARPAAGEWAIDGSPTLLFCFSALTYNAHRIPYDRDYAVAAEGYPGLLVHGPLQAVAMAEAVRAAGGHGGSGQLAVE